MTSADMVLQTWEQASHTATDYSAIAMLVKPRLVDYSGYSPYSGHSHAGPLQP
jgi:hypothetical protein